MNWSQFQALLWLRWRLMVNQWRRGGTFAAVPAILIAVGAVLLAGTFFLSSLALGLFATRKMSPLDLLYAWDGLVVAFVFFWIIGLVSELQRTEALTLSKFLHLPISVKGAFLINYVSSMLRLSTVVFVPLMLGLWLALVGTKGPWLLLVLPLLAAFLLMVTALSYQFQGWLASLMINPRLRRTIVVGISVVFVLVFQVPYLMNVFGRTRIQRDADASQSLMRELEELNAARRAQKFDDSEHLRRQQELLERNQQETDQARRESAQRWQQTTRIANLVLPLGWLPLGVMSAAEGNLLPTLLGGLGMAGIGAASLWRAYQTTVRIYRGQYTARKVRPVAVVVEETETKRGVLLVERHLFGFSESVSVIALAGLRSLLRAPESKLMLLTPLLLCVILGSTLSGIGEKAPPAIRPLAAIGAMLVALFGMLQLMANQFGFDRDGFRVFTLCAVPRRDILLGKNLTFVPFALAMATIVLVIVEVVLPLRIDHLLAMLPQFVSMFLLFCPVVNLLSIYTPLYIAAGSLKPANPKLLPMLLQLVMIFFLFPLFQAPTVLPLGMEVALERLGWTKGFPVFLTLSLVECAVVVLGYRFLLDWQGGLLQKREQIILDVVTNRGP